MRITCTVLSAAIVFCLSTIYAPGAEAQATQLFYSVTNFNGSVEAGENIYVSNLDGSSAQILIAGVEVSAFIVNENQSKIYFIDRISGDIRSANLDGSGLSTIFSTGLFGITGLAIDFVNSRAYYAHWFGGEVRRVDLNGSNDQAVVTGAADPNCVAVDPIAGLIFYTDTSPGIVSSADLDGNGVQTILSGLSFPIGITVDAGSGHVYISDPGTGTIERVDYNGSNATTLVTGEGGNQKIVLDLSSNLMYWAGGGTGVIRRANLNGSSVTSIVPSIAPTHLIRGVAVGVAIQSLPAAQTRARILVLVLLLLVGGVYLRRRLAIIPNE